MKCLLQKYFKGLPDKSGLRNAKYLFFKYVLYVKHFTPSASTQAE